MIVDVACCARCGEDHTELEFFKFTNPMWCDGKLYEYWAMCPFVNEPIFMCVTEI